MSFSTDVKLSAGGARPGLTQVLYRSRSVASVQSGMQMSDILDQAREGNSRDYITGVLTSAGGYFVQIIEGAEPVIDALLTRLGRDTRHTDLEVLERRVVGARLFGDWDMVSPRLAPIEVASVQLLFSVPGAGIDDYAAILNAAVMQQEALLDGRRARGSTDRDAPYIQSDALKPVSRSSSS